MTIRGGHNQFDAPVCVDGQHISRTVNRRAAPTFGAAVYPSAEHSDLGGSVHATVAPVLSPNDAEVRPLSSCVQAGSARNADAGAVSRLSIQQLVFVHEGQRWRWIKKERVG